MKKQNFNVMDVTKRLCAFLLAAVLLVGLLGIGAVSAKSNQGVQRMNVMLVIDGSGSLPAGSDPRGLRYDALDLFLALLTNQGNNVGAIVFNEGFNTFRLHTEITELSGKGEKLELSEQIKKAGADGDTNIGAALLLAVEEAAAKNAENGLPSVIILFSDGRTDVTITGEGKYDREAAMEESLAAKEEAVVNAQQANIPVYSICLNNSAVADPAELEEISNRTSGEFVSVSKPEDLAAAFESFYTLIFQNADGEVEETSFPGDGHLSYNICIPSYGAEEVNIILDTSSLNSLTITSPAGELTKEQVNDFTMSGGQYDVIKLVDPQQGIWQLELNGIPEEAVTINVMYNVNSTVQLETSDSGHDYGVGDTVTFEANLVEDGVVITDPSVTQEYTAKLILTNKQGGQPLEVDMTPGSNGTFTYTMTGNEYTSYDAEAVLTYSNLSIISNQWPVNFGNTAPTVNPDWMEVKKIVTPITGRSYENDLTQYFSDEQDPTLTYSIVSSQLVADTVTLDEKTGALYVNTAKSRSGNLVIQAADSQGATVQLTIYFNVKNITIPIFIAIVAGILVAVILLGASAYAASQRVWRGEIVVKNLYNGFTDKRGDFRGSLPLKKFGAIGECGIDGKFVACSAGQIEFRSKKPVFLGNGFQSEGLKIVPLTSGVNEIYADENHTRGIEVNIENASSGGGWGFGGNMDLGGKKKKKKANTDDFGGFDSGFGGGFSSGSAGGFGGGFSSGSGGSTGKKSKKSSGGGSSMDNNNPFA